MALAAIGGDTELDAYKHRIEELETTLDELTAIVAELERFKGKVSALVARYCLEAK